MARATGLLGIGKSLGIKLGLLLWVLSLGASCASQPRLPSVDAQRIAEWTATASTTVRGSVQSESYRFEKAGKDIPFAYYVPTSYDASRPMPLVILLHGLFSNPDQVIRYQGITDEAEKRGYIVFAPMGYNDKGWYGAFGPGRPPEQMRVGTEQQRADIGPENLGELSEQDVWNVYEIARKRFNTDPSRTYIMGHSMGGGGTLHFAMRKPETWAAAASFSPAYFNDPQRVSAMKGVPVIVVQGDKDRLVNVDDTRRLIDAMRQLGLEHRYIEIGGGDHIVSITRNPQMIGEVFDFLDAHPRKS